MRTITPPLAAVLLSLSGGAGATAQSRPPGPLIDIDPTRAVNACIPAAERNRPMAEVSQARRRQIVACIFANTSRQANAQLPRQVDNVTRLDRITSSGATLTYRYTVSTRLADLPANAREIIEQTTRANVCAQANMVQTMQMGGAYTYRWVDPDGRQIHQMTVSRC